MDLRWTPPPLPLTGRVAALGVLAVFVAVGAAQGLPDRPALGAVGIAATLAGATASLLATAKGRLLFAAVAVAGIAALGTSQAYNVVWFGVCIMVGWLVLALPAFLGLSFWVAAELVIGAEALFSVRDPGWSAWAAGTLFTAVGCLFAQRQRHLVEQLRDAQAGLADRARAEERNRVAREVHDVIAHSLTVSLLHVSSARLAVRDDPTGAEAELAEAERLGRQSLDEVRHTVGLLRTGSDATAPLPGGADLPELVERFRRAGVPIDAALDPLDRLTAVVGLGVYRIVQEALTNAARHAPAAAVRVSVTRSPEQLSIEVDSAGPPVGDKGGGHGLIGIRERATALGGTCTAGPGGAGWLVRAHVPLSPGVVP